MTKHLHGNTQIEFSREAAVAHNGVIYSAFARYSYVARVRFPSHGVVVVVLPAGAARETEASWVERVHEAALSARHGEVVVL
jgi:hypothetical protein